MIWTSRTGMFELAIDRRHAQLVANNPTDTTIIESIASLPEIKRQLNRLHPIQVRKELARHPVTVHTDDTVNLLTLLQVACNDITKE